ncbi:MAG: GNAT family N-acetyltransferase [Bacillota bacterium]
MARVDESHRLWNEARRHLERVDDWRWIVDDSGRLKGSVTLLVGFREDRAAANLSLLRRRLEIPSDPPRPVTADGNELWEHFVMTFSVEPDCRRMGLGTLLQREAIRLSLEMGLWQLRSWSSVDKTANYELKLKLGFSFSPGKQRGIPGGYFVRRLVWCPGSAE